MAFAPLCVLALAADSHHHHLWRVFRDDAALLTPPPSRSGGRRLDATHEHSATIAASDTHLHLSYTATPHERHTLRLLEPELAPRISAIVCNTTHVTVTGASNGLSEELLRRFSPGDIITGACPGESGDEPFYRRAVASEAHTLSAITFATEHIALHEVFDALSLSFRWSPPGRPRPQRSRGAPPSPPSSPPPPPPPPPPPSPPPHAHAGRRRLFLSDIIEGVSNRLGEGLVDAAGALLDYAGNLLGFDATDGFSGSVLSAVREHWVGLTETLRALFQGFRIQEQLSLNLVELNYDNTTRGARNASIPLFHTPWLLCDDCYVRAEVDAELDIEFEAGGVPKLVHAEVGAAFDGKIVLRCVDLRGPGSPYRKHRVLRAELPTPAPANDMGNWHNIIPRVWLGTFRFTVGYVPVTVSVAAELNGASWSSAELDAEFTAGVQVSAAARMGVHWDEANEWRKVQEADWNHTFFSPTWRLSEANASVRAAISPELVMLVWGAVPLEVKPKVIVGAHLGANAVAIPQQRELDKLLPLGFADSMLPVLDVPPAARRRAQAADAQDPLAQCDAGREYALSSAVHLGIGIEDVALPTSAPSLASKGLAGRWLQVLSALPGVDASDDLLLVGGVDFGEATLLQEAGFPACGRLCRGCFPDYLAAREEMEAEARPVSAEGQAAAAASPHGTDSARLALILTLLVLGLLLLPVLLLQLPLALLGACAPETAARWRAAHPRLARLERAYAAAEARCRSCVRGKSYDGVELDAAPQPPPAPGPGGHPASPVESWSAPQVATWLRQAGLGQYAARVEKQQVGG